MALINLDLNGSFAIDQGYQWRMVIMYPGNVVGAGIRGDIKASYEGGTLTGFRSEPSSYDATTDYTKFPIILSAQQTKNLPLTTGQYWVYDIEISLMNAPPKRLLAGQVEVVPSSRSFT